MKSLALVCLGGALGSAARYGVTLAAARWFGAALWGTFAVNVVGSFAIAILAVAWGAGTLSDDARLGVGVGVFGGFTTYSTFNAEALALVRDGAAGSAALYIAATVVGCLAAGAAGFWSGRHLFAIS